MNDTTKIIEFYALNNDELEERLNKIKWINGRIISVKHLNDYLYEVIAELQDNIE